MIWASHLTVAWVFFCLGSFITSISYYSSQGRVDSSEWTLMALVLVVPPGVLWLGIVLARWA